MTLLTLKFSLKKITSNNKLRVNSLCLLCRTELVPEKTAVEHLRANDLSTAAGKIVQLTKNVFFIYVLILSNLVPLMQLSSVDMFLQTANQES